MFLFYVLSFFKKGDTIQGGILFKGGQYLRKYGISKIKVFNRQNVCSSVAWLITKLIFLDIKSIHKSKKVYMIWGLWVP